MKEIIVHDIKCKIGSNAVENWDILAESKPYYLFFHLSSFPSCFLILECDENLYVDNKIIEESAILCKQNTKYKNLKNIKVDYTLCKNIEKGNKTGQVFYKSNRQVKTIKI